MRHRVNLLVCLACAIALLTPACADVVIDWNNVALETIKATDLRPTYGSRTLAMVHVAIYDAVNSIVRTHEPYRVDAPVQHPASPEAAAAAAAHRVLVALFPEMAAFYDQALAASLSQTPSGQARNNGIAVGVYVADAILAWRSQDHSGDVWTYTPGTLPGLWRPTPPEYAPAVGVNWPYVTPFAMFDVNQISVPPPPSMSSRAYAEAVTEIALLGEMYSRHRNRDQTQIAFFWADDAGSVSPPGRLNVIAQIVGTKKRFSLAQNARHFALLNISLADACIAAWNCKYKYNVWRPITAIREADTDDNYYTSPIPGWTPLLPTPAFPDYVSGHSTFAGAGSRITALFCGTDNFAFTLESTTPYAGARRYKSFSEAAKENGRSRIYAGIHYSFADVNGQALGRKIAEYVWANYMRPIK